MPNHIHGILILDKPIGINDDDVNDFITDTVVETGHALSLQQKQRPAKPQSNPSAIGHNRYQNIGKNTVSSIIGSYKSAVTNHANRLQLQNGWQPRFHDHIIRNDAEYQRISNYIVNNPSNWNNDKFNSLENKKI